MKTNLSDYIREDLRSRIISGRNVPNKLTLPVLAETYGVSLMPVRLAVQDLVDERILLRLDNGRLDLNTTKIAAQKSRAPKAQPALPAEPYDVIMKEVLALSLRGEEREMKIIPCAERYGISRSMLHAIFHRLAAQGLLVHAPRKGWTVRPFRPADLDSYLTVREALELLALDLARDRLEPDKLRELHELNDPQSAKGARAATRVNNSLHGYWVEKSHNRYIQDFFVRNQVYYDLLLSHAVLRRQLIDESLASHRRILEAMLRRDWSAARGELVQDIRRLGPLLKQTAEKLESE